jgi:hypothetical protein
MKLDAHIGPKSSWPPRQLRRRQGSTCSACPTKFWSLGLFAVIDSLALLALLADLRRR